MPTFIDRLTSSVALAVVLSTAATAGRPPSPGEGAQTPSLPVWETLTFSASKLMITARSRLTVGEENADSAKAQWAQVDGPGRASEADLQTTVRLESKTSMLSRTSVTTVWVQPASLEAYQRTLLETGSRARKKVYRFSDSEAIAFRSEPANNAEKELPEAQWTNRSEQRIDTAHAPTLTDPLTLFYLIATHPHDKLDKGIEVSVLTRNRISRVRIQRTPGATAIKTASTVTNADGSQQRDRSSNLAVRTYEVTPIGDASDLRLLGLEGAIQVAVDESLRMPVEIRGKIPPVGRVTVKLKSATLR